MNFDESIELSLRTWYPEDHPLHFNPHHPLGKLIGELGELLDDYMKSIYKPGYVFEPLDELGDIWYYLRILCYQNNYTRLRKLDNIIIPELNLTIDISNKPIDILIKVLMYEVSQHVLIKEIGSNATSTKLMLSIQYSGLKEIAYRYNITFEQLTNSNWEKLKPGSKRGNEWAKARVGADDTG